MLHRFVAPSLIAITALLPACGGASSFQKAHSTEKPKNQARSKSPSSNQLPSRELIRRLMKESGADGDMVLKALYPMRDKLDDNGELSEDDEMKVRMTLVKIDGQVADRIERMHQNALLDMERYVDQRTRGDCQGVADSYGVSRDTPLQVGGAAAGSSLFMGTLLCPGNRLASVEGRFSGPVGTYKRPNQDNADLPIDTWTVQCGPKAYTFYSDLYTRGRFCAPKGFELIPLRAREAYALSWDAFKAKKFEDALLLVREAIAKGGPVAEFLEHRAFIELELGKTKAARASLRSALRASPRHEGVALNWAGIEFREGTSKQADAAFAHVLQTIPESHENYRLAWCMAAETKTKLRSKKDRTRGQQMAEEGCAAKDEGNERCCAVQSAQVVKDVSEQ